MGAYHTRYFLTRDVTPAECSWLESTIRKGESVFQFRGHTYGCIGPGGIAVTRSPEGKNPFFELPDDALSETESRQ